MRLAVILFIATLPLSTGSLRAEETKTAAPATLVEVQLSAFQQAALAADEPVRDTILTDGNTMWLLGRTSLWRWNLPGKSLKRLRFGEQKVVEDDQLARLGTDGVSIFAAGDKALYQVAWDQGRVFRYALKSRGPSFGFFGRGDDYWLARAAGLLHFDRYGRTLQPKGANLKLTADDRAVYDVAHKITWIARKTKLLRQRLDETAAKTTMTTSHRILGIAWADDELILHTAHSVMRVGLDGKLKDSIPVEGRRKLVSMAVTSETHAYLFDDDLLEVYDVKTRTVGRHRLGLGVDGPSEIKGLALSSGYATVLAEGRPRAFRMNP